MRDHADNVSVDSEYDEGPLDGKIMQIFLPDIMPAIRDKEDKEEEETSVRIVKLDEHFCEKVDDDEDSSADPGEMDSSEYRVVEPAAEEQQPILAWEEYGGHKDALVEQRVTSVRESVIVGPPVRQEEAIITSGEEDTGNRQAQERDEMEEEEEEEQGEDMLQILAIVPGEHGGVQQITVVANNGAAGIIGGGGGGSRQSVISDQIRRLFTGWEEGAAQQENFPSSEAEGESAPMAAMVGRGGEGGESKGGSVLNILQLQMVAGNASGRVAGDYQTLPADTSRPRHILINHDELKGAVAAVEHEELLPGLIPATKATLLATRESYSKKSISRSVEHSAEGRKSIGTQASSWTKMAADRVKVARHKVIRPRGGGPADAALDSQQLRTVAFQSGGGEATAPEDGGSAGLSSSISMVELLGDQQQRRSIGTQVC